MILSTLLIRNIYRGYYTVARRYEFYVRVARTIQYNTLRCSIVVYQNILIGCSLFEN